MPIDVRRYIAPPGKPVDLDEWPTLVKPFFDSKERYAEILAKHVATLSALQDIHYASGRYAVLLILQGMDAAGKDGLIKHILSGVNPEGCDVYSFKQPTAQELAHDFLWRTTCRLPERGRIGIFNRSYYEDVLVVRVHPELLESSGLPKELRHPKRVWDGRYRSIVELENHLHRNGTRTIKIFLHLSKEEQRKRLLGRIDEPNKNWKIALSDVRERRSWKSYREAYERCIEATSTERAPWYVVPADDKDDARLIASQILLDVFKDLHEAFPKTDSKRALELQAIREELTSKKDEYER